MCRLVFLLCSFVVAGRAVQITEFVNCGGAKQTVVVSQEAPAELACELNGVEAGVHLIGGFLGSFELVAVPFPPGPQLPPAADVEATYNIMGDFVLHVGNPMVAYWNFCFQVDSVGTGIGSASGFFGPFPIGEPCDFAHAVPFPSSGSVTFTINLSGKAAGNDVLGVEVEPDVFDAEGNLTGGDFSLSPLPNTGVPEPSTVVPAALALMGLRLMRRRL